MAGDSRTQKAKDKVEEAATSAAHRTQEAASSAANKAQETASSLGHRAQEAASNLGHRAQEMASNVTGRAQDLASSAAERADQGVAAVGQGMSSLADTLRQRAPHEGMLGSAAGTIASGLETGGQYLQEHGLGDIGGDIGNLVRQYPVASLMVVFGFGYLLGSSMRR